VVGAEPEGCRSLACSDVGSSTRSLRIFFASSAALVTDHRPSGEGLIAWHLLSGLARRGHAVVACADGADLQQRAPFELIVLPDAQRFESLSPYTRPYAIDRAFERRGGSSAFDIVHWLFPQQHEEVRLPRTNGSCRTVLGPLPFAWGASDREHGFRAGDLVRAPLTPWLQRRYLRERARADVLLASLPGVRAALPPAEAARARLLGFGIDAARYDVRPLPEVPRIAFVGRLIENKGVRTLYAAFRTLAATRSDIELVFAGDGSLRPWLEQRRSDDGLESRIHLPGAVPHSEIGGVLAECSVLCLPSVGEPFGMVILEAMAAGRPVVAVDRGGPAHLLRDEQSGLLVPPEDPAALAAALGRVLDDPMQTYAMGRHNRRKAETTLSWEAVLDELEVIYRAARNGDSAPSSVASKADLRPHPARTPGS
jgi:glycosyltransferase involved in cell wall biosynthesis